MCEKCKCGICGRMEYEAHMCNDVDLGMCCRRHYTQEELNNIELANQLEAALERNKELEAKLVEAQQMSVQSLPRLTVDVFNRADCPEWARYAVVFRTPGWTGEAFYFECKPIFCEDGAWRADRGRFEAVQGRPLFDSSDCCNSMVERPVEKVFDQGNIVKVINPSHQAYGKIGYIFKTDPGFWVHFNNGSGFIFQCEDIELV